MEFQGRASAQGRVWVDPCVDPPRSDATRGPTGPRPGLDCEPKSRLSADFSAREEETQVHLAEGRGNAGPRRCFRSFGGVAAPGRGGPTPLATVRASGAFPPLLLPLTLQTTANRRCGVEGVGAPKRRGGGGAMASAEDPEEARLEEVTQRLLAATAACTQQGDAVRALKAELKAERASKVSCCCCRRQPHHHQTPPPVPQLPPPGGLSRAPAPASRPGRGRPLAPSPFPSPSPSAPADEEPSAAPGTLRADPPPSPLRTCARRTWPRRSRS